MDKIRVLIVDDEVQLTQAFKKKLEREGFAVCTVPLARDVFPLLKKQAFDVGVLDIKLPDMDGIDLLSRLKEMEPNFEIVMLTGHASVDTAIKSMKLGAYGYLIKPCKISELGNVILKAYEKKSLKEKNILLEKQLQRAEFHDEFVGESRRIRELKSLISLVSASDVPILVTGETGTGKELIARAVHESSPRAHNPFVAINSSTLQEAILESELFGYKRGAFTGAHGDKMGLLEIADKGTFFVDEVGDMCLPIQAKLLRVLETGVFMKLGDVRENRVNVRFIFATNKRLEEEVVSNRFRKDLLYRINAFVVAVPPLRDRKRDIPLLADYFISKFSKDGKRKAISSDAMKLLLEYEWPGNVRELANVVERAMLLSAARDGIVADDFPLSVRTGSSDCRLSRKSAPQEDDFRLDGVVKSHIEKVLRYTGENKSKAARLLGISRKKFYQKLGSSS
jgi:DNA-binding NtrC family response regulator